MAEMRYVTVAALTKYIKRKFEVDPHLQDLWIKGEISNFTYHSRGHMYFTLKDEQARIQAVMFAGYNRQLTFKPENGMTVLVRGEISVYEPSGTYQVYVKEMQPDGVGALYLAYEQLKKKLEQEGLFAKEHKKPIPKFPQHIGVVTSPTGAAIRDILTTIRRRYPLAKVILFPTLVQGEQAPLSIVQSIQKANDIGYIDVLIVGRGGGSIEELWAFNEEMVARAIFHSRVPIISAVGHETDYTIADFVADLRAPTPTGAAELAVPHVADLLLRVSDQQARLIRAMKERMNAEQKRLQSLRSSYAFRYPKRLYEQKEQQLDMLVDRLQRQMNDMFKQKEHKLQQLQLTLFAHHPQSRVEKAVDRVRTLEQTIVRHMNDVIKQKKWSLATAMAKLDALSPLKIMERGYSLAYDEQETLIKTVKQLQEGDRVHIRFQDGRAHCIVSNIEEEKI
ncbi:exodeoxyribonuclease VII large subunit [Anoxybacillus ayderensis]|uniref:exodeoxyribonuclease VII large subunit n=1 Tax=Anoxybacillus TaxID=150247 RepID=UPI0002DC9461|nr:exodeoxyribonuclease VII large subunit [Anoxybacillus ayderensis G10]NNU97447.1 exodeoxyribonuclease VII large subunit [Anoxybacillus sp. EFIL]THD17124.1 exodeoxyribonuclease VII large subunit [Anoxybacillus ayderensis]